MSRLAESLAATFNVPRGFEDKVFIINTNIAPWGFPDEGHILVENILKFTKLYFLILNSNFELPSTNIFVS